MIDRMLNAKDSAEYPNVERYCENCGDDVYVRGELLCSDCKREEDAPADDRKGE